MTNGPCERCGQRPHSWSTDAGYLCAPCADEWRLWREIVVPVMVGREPVSSGGGAADNGDNR